MPTAVRSFRATPRWPATGERFEDGWTALSAARPLLDHLTRDASDAAAIDAAVTETLRRVHAAADAEVLALLAAEATQDIAPPAVVLRRVIADDEVIDPPALAVTAGEAVVPRVADALTHVAPATFAVEAPLALPGDSRSLGALVALAAADDDVDEWAARMRSVLEQVAWVFVLTLRRGWQAWREATAWPGLGADELSLCRTALEHARRAADALRHAGDDTGTLHRVRVERRWDPAAWPGPSDTAPAPRAVDENVQFTVYRPRRIPVETWCTVLAFAHLAERRPDAPPSTPDPVEEVRRQAAQVLGDLASTYADTTQDSADAIPRAGEITFSLDLPDLEVNPSQRSFRWLEDVQREEFHVRASRALDGRTARGTLHVYLGAIVVAEVALAIRVDGAASASVPPEVESAHARPYRRIFPSYSHLDEPIVQQVEAYARTLGDEYLRDVTHLRSGEVWSERLADFIRTADVFQLFWSRNSMASTWVRREWEYALSLGRPFFVRPTYWEMPMPEAPDLPPPALRALHFQRLPLAPPADAPRAVPAPAPVAAPAPPPPRDGAPEPARATRVAWMQPLALAAVLFVALVGGTITWNAGKVVVPGPVGTPNAGPAEETKPASPASLAAVSPDGRLAAVMDAGARIVITRRDAAGTVERVIQTSLARADIVALRFSSDGTRIVCETRDGATVEWDARTGERVSAPA
jgi:TIR domain-containing protein